MKRGAFILVAAAMAMALPSPASAQRRDPPYWASITAGRAMMRAGPGQNFPGLWLYVRRGLPVRVVEVYQNWRKVQDPEGTTGWMLVNLLSADRTGMVRGDGVKPMHVRPDADSAIRFRAEPGVVGRISRCDDNWCRFAVGGRNGYIRATDLWGVEQNEEVE